MTTWPTSLPRRPPEGAWAATLVDPTVRNQPEIGPPMARARATTDFMIFQGTLVLSRADYRTLYLFWRDDCGNGASTFTGPDWITEDNVTMQFGAAPKPSHRGRDFLNVEVVLIRRPVA